MYGRYGANDCFASYAGSPIYEDGEYGLVWFLAIPLYSAGAAGAAAIGTSIAEGINAYRSNEEAKGYTGGTIKLAGCEGTDEECRVSADEAWARVCAAGIAGEEHCETSPSGEGRYYADPPEGLAELLTETIGGYDARKMGAGPLLDAADADCPTGKASEDPRCKGMDPNEDKRTLPIWVWFAGAAAIGAVIFFAPTAKKGAA